MASVKDLIAKGFIDVDDEITFRTHADVLMLFGRDHNVFQRAFAKHPIEPDVYIWFPIFGYDPANEWENSKRGDWETVFERRIEDNQGYLAEITNRLDQHKRILFSKDSVSKAYRFRGIYLFDSEVSALAKKAAYRRIATSVELVSSNQVS